MQGIGANAQFQAMLQSDSLLALHTREASLDDIFIRATAGRETL